MSRNWQLPQGNDNVDLRAAARHRPAYYERLKRSSFYPEELLLVQEYESAFWLLLAAKESAFKAVAQAGRVDRRFNPKDFLLKEIHHTDEGIIYTIVSHLHVLYGDMSTNACHILASREIQQLYSGATYGRIYCFVVELVNDK